MKKVLISMLLVALTLCLFVGCSSEPKEPEQIDESLYTMKGSDWFTALTSETDVIKKASITDIVFCKEIPTGTMVVSGVDLTKNGTEKVNGYIIENGDNYKAFIVGDYIFGSSCLDMFHGFTNLKSMDLSIFNTLKVTDMECMFEYCSELTS